MAELKRYFDRERMFIVCPPEKEINSRANAILDDSALMNDFKFLKDDVVAQASEGPNTTVRHFFQAMLPTWTDQETVLISHKEIVAQFNQETAGMYRASCVTSFMQPLMLAGAVEQHDSQTLRIHVRRAADIIQ